MVVIDVDRSVALALSALLLLALLASSCSFEQSPLVSGNGTPRVTPPSVSGSGDGRDGEPSGPSSSPTGSADDGETPITKPPPSAGAGSKPIAGSDAPAPIDAGQDDGKLPVDAGMDEEPDTGPDPDPKDAGCAEEPECVCAHERLETPDDPCAAPDCPLSECAPDDTCELMRFESSVYYLCSDERPQDEASERCESIDDMHLVYIETDDEDAFLDGVIEGKAWIGAVVDEEGVWSWLDGTPFYDEESEEPVDDTYVDWDEEGNEPNSLGVGLGSVTCAITWSETDSWADTNCPAPNPYVCELEL